MLRAAARSRSVAHAAAHSRRARGRRGTRQARQGPAGARNSAHAAGLLTSARKCIQFWKTACGTGDLHAVLGKWALHRAGARGASISACGAGRMNALHGGDRHPAYARPQAGPGAGGGRACSTRVKHSRWCAVGSPMWNVRVTSVVPQSYWPPVHGSKPRISNRHACQWERARAHRAACHHSRHTEHRSGHAEHLHSRSRRGFVGRPARARSARALPRAAGRGAPLSTSSSVRPSTAAQEPGCAR